MAKAKSRKSKKARAAKKRVRKMPKAVLARFAAWRARNRPRVELDGVNLITRRKHTKRSRKIAGAVGAAVRGVSPRTRHGDVRFNPTLSELRAAVKRGVKAGVSRFKKTRAKQKAIAGRYVELDGHVYSPGPARMSMIKAVRGATGAKHGNVKWNPVLSHREGAAIMRRAAKLKRKTGKTQKKFVTKSGRVQTLAAAELRMQGKRANRRWASGNYYVGKGPERPRPIKMSDRGGSGASGGGRAAGTYEPLVDLGML